MTMKPSKLDQYRGKIDTLDQKILRLLSQRGRVAQSIGKIKQKAGKNFHVPERESLLLRRLAKENTGPYPSSAIESIYREIVSASLALEAPLVVAYLGPEGTYSYLAALEQFGKGTQYIAEEHPRDIFSAVASKKAEYGILPIENTIEGVVTHHLDLFMDFSLTICGEVEIPVTHNLLSKERNKEKVKTVYSHPHALSQCRQWLDRKLSQAKRVAVSSTAKAAQMARDKPGAAAIASEYASKLYHVPIRARRIEDYAHNVTRFLILGRVQPAPSGHDRTSIMFSVKDEPGALFKILKPLADAHINLTKIESRPLKKRNWEYIFFIDIDGHMEDEEVSRVLRKMERVCNFVQVLGSYPKEIHHD